uniref:Putative secreted protein n=1 Tax=Rhipicephalus microplus TaxID=6941 RepID=A0A6M2DAF9_RHIMP
MFCFFFFFFCEVVMKASSQSECDISKVCRLIIGVVDVMAPVNLVILCPRVARASYKRGVYEELDIFAIQQGTQDEPNFCTFGKPVNSAFQDSIVEVENIDWKG